MLKVEGRDLERFRRAFRRIMLHLLEWDLIGIQLWELAAAPDVC